MNKNESKFKNLKGLILAISIVVGTVIGTGIFFKNNSMIAWAQGNGYIVMGAWLIGSVIAISAAVAFSQIAKGTKKSNVGVGQLTEEMVGKKVGWHTKINWVYYFFPWNVVLISLYSSDYIMKIVFPGSPGATNHTIVALIVAFSILVFFGVLNTVWNNIGNWIQISATALKVIPLIILAVGAFYLVFVMPEHNWWSNNGTAITPYDPVIANDTKGMNPLLVVLFIVPGTLFAYDSFINATNVSESVKKKHVTYAIVGGMIFIAFIYLMVTVAILSTGTLYAEDAIIKLFGGDPKNLSVTFIVIKKIIQFFILISALGGANGYALAWTNAIRAVNKKNNNKNTFISMGIGLLIIGSPMLFVTIIIYFTRNSNIGITFADALSNPLIIISYSIYAMTLLFAVFRNIKQKERNKKYAWWFNYAAILAGIIILFLLGYIFFYSIIYKSLFVSGSTFGGLPGWIFLIIALAYLSLWFLLPFILKKFVIKSIISHSDDEAVYKKTKK